MSLKHSEPDVPLSVLGLNVPFASTGFRWWGPRSCGRPHLWIQIFFAGHDRWSH